MCVTSGKHTQYLFSGLLHCAIVGTHTTADSQTSVKKMKGNLTPRLLGVAARRCVKMKVSPRVVKIRAYRRMSHCGGHRQRRKEGKKEQIDGERLSVFVLK